MDSEHSLLKRMGVEVTPVSGGCCGLAGSWGFEQGHYDVSMASGELALLPAVREAQRDTIVVADGFSCKTQIAQSDAGREALHVAQLMKMAREHGAAGVTGTLPEEPYAGARPAPPLARRAARAAATAGVLATGAAAASPALLVSRRSRGRRRR